LDWSSCLQLFWIWQLTNSVLIWHDQYKSFISCSANTFWVVCTHVICIAMNHISESMSMSLGESGYAPWQPHNFSSICIVVNSSQKLCRNLDSTVYFYHYQIADGMTIQVSTVNLLLETRGGAQHGGGATW